MQNKQKPKRDLFGPKVVFFGFLIFYYVPFERDFPEVNTNHCAIRTNGRLHHIKHYTAGLRNCYIAQ